MDMTELNKIIEVTVVKPQVFGLFCEYYGKEMLLLIPETSWVASYNSALQFAQKGDQLKVKVIDYSEEKDQYSISIKSIYPNPWKNDSFKVGNIYKSFIRRKVNQADRLNYNSGYLVEIIPGSFVMLDSEGENFEENEVCEVVITQIDERKYALKIELTKANST